MRTRICFLAVVLAHGTISIAGIAVESDANPVPPNDWGQQVLADQRWVTILCRFSDDSSTPHVAPWYVDVMDHVDAYFKEASLGTVDIGGEEVIGWFDLPHSRRYYFTDDGVHMDDDKLIRECAGAADNEIYFLNYQGVTLWVNGTLRNYATGRQKDHGTQALLDFDGVRKLYRLVVISSDDVNPLGVLSHEIGHTFGWGHSGIGERQAYSSYWDLMSSVSQGCGYRDQYPEWCVPVHPIAIWKHFAGWIADSEVIDISPGERMTFRLYPHEVPGSSDGYLLARVPILGSTSRFLTIEARRGIGFDNREEGTAKGLPAEGVLVHMANMFNQSVFLLDADSNDGELSDEEAALTVGEEFVEPESGVAVDIESEGEGGHFLVSVSSPSLPEVNNDDIENRIAILGLKTDINIHTYLATSADSDPVLSCTGERHGHTVWFEFVAPKEGRLSLRTEGSDHSTVLGIFKRGKEGELHPLACASDHGAWTGSTIEDFPTYANKSYLIESGSYYGWDGGDLHLTASFDEAKLPKPVKFERSLHLYTKRETLHGLLLVEGPGFEGACVARVTVEIQKRNVSDWTTVSEIVTEGDGSFRIAARQMPRHRWRAIAPAFPLPEGRCLRAVAAFTS